MGRLSRDLERVRGVFGRDGFNHLDMWHLCLTEGPLRMRKKILKNDLFYLRYPYDPSGKDAPVLSFASEEYYRKYHHQEESLVSSLDADFSDLNISIEANVGEFQKPSSEKFSENLSDPLVNKSVEESDSRSDVISASSTLEEEKDVGEKEDGVWEVDEEMDADDNQQISRLMEPGDRIEFMFNCARVERLDGVDGLLILGRTNIYVVDNFCISSDEEVVHVEQAVLSGKYERIAPVVPISGMEMSPEEKKISRKKSNAKIVKWHYNDIQEVHKRRYLLQNVGIEIFSADGRNYLFALKKSDRDKVITKIMSMSPNAVMPLDPDSSTGGLFSSLWGTSSSNSITQSWVKGEISNFQYLMFLNTLAGRTYNDLTQYPVFSLGNC